MQTQSSCQKGYLIITAFCSVQAQSCWLSLKLHQVVKQLFVQTLVYCRFILVATILLICKEVFLFGLVHYCLANPLVVCIKIHFEEQNNTKLFHIKVSCRLFYHDVDAFLPMIIGEASTKWNVGNG